MRRMGHAPGGVRAGRHRSGGAAGRHGRGHRCRAGDAQSGGALMLQAAFEPGMPADFEVFRRRAYTITGLDLTSYKAPQMHRRLSALLSRLNVGGFAEYARLLENNAERRQEFRDYVTINVSEFFRDSDRFSDFERRVLPELLANSASVRVWSAGCSIGAEPYSLAILLSELGPGRNHRILATRSEEHTSELQSHLNLV